MMELGYVVLRSACKDLFLNMNLIKEIGLVFDICAKDKSRFHVHIHEDNVGASLLGQLEPR